jgi:DNA-binding transcriptional MerR regulator
MLLPWDSTYSTSQIGEKLGISARAVIVYVERGYVKPSIQDASGYASKRIWSHMDLVRCAVVKELSAWCSTSSIRQIMPQLKEDSLRSVRSVRILGKGEVYEAEGRDHRLDEEVFQMTIKSYVGINLEAIVSSVSSQEA